MDKIDQNFVTLAPSNATNVAGLDPKHSQFSSLLESTPQITPIGALMIKSIRTDYQDVSEYKFRLDQEKNIISRTEYHEIKLNKTIDLRVVAQCPITRIELVNFPSYKCTLNGNGRNICSTDNGIFDIESTFNSMLDTLIELGLERAKSQSGPCMCIDGCHCDEDFIAPPTRSLYGNMFDTLKICHPKGVTFPEELIIKVTGYYHPTTKSTRTYTINPDNTYDINENHPTDYIVLQTKDNEPGGSVTLYINDEIAAIWPAQNQPYVIKFQRGPIEGVEDGWLRDMDTDTLNFSRIDKMHLVTRKCSPDTMFQSCIITYFLPNYNYNQTLMPMYKT